jgi:hypothetical protein
VSPPWLWPPPRAQATQECAENVSVGGAVSDLVDQHPIAVVFDRMNFGAERQKAQNAILGSRT